MAMFAVGPHGYAMSPPYPGGGSPVMSSVLGLHGKPGGPGQPPGMVAASPPGPAGFFMQQQGMQGAATAAAAGRGKPCLLLQA